jgi:hypothetical protein
MTGSDDRVTDRWRRRTIWLFGASSLLAVGLGAAVMALGGLSPGLWMRNPAAWLVAAVLGLFLARGRWLSRWMAPVALAVIAFSLTGPGQDGVHRWLGFGPVQVNAAALVLPLAIAGFSNERHWLAVFCVVLIAAVLAVILCIHRFGWRGAIVALAVAVATIALCLFRPDPLEAVAHVEGIVAMAWNQSPAFAIAMAASLAATVLSPLLLWPVRELRSPAAALSGYFAATALACLFGAYPVPLAGYGLSFVVGWWLGLAALAVRQARARPEQSPS